MKKHFSFNLIGFIGVLTAVVLIFLTILAATGSFHYRKTELVIRTGSAEKTYDGTPLTSSRWFLVSGTLAEEHELVVETRGSQTEIGKSDNVAMVKVVDSSGLDVSDQYTIKAEYGDLTVERRKLTFVSEDAEKIWDGTPLIQHKVYLINGRVYGDNTWEAYEFNEPTRVGTYQNTYQVRITDSEGQDVSDNYEIELTFGQLTIRQGYLVIASGSEIKEYDGEDLVNTDCHIEEGGIAEGHNLQMQAVGRVQEVGFCKNTIQVSITDQDGMDVTELYDITLNTGLLTVIPRRLTVQTMDVTRPYYDKAIEDDWSLVGGTLLEGDELKVSTRQQSTYEYDEEIGTFDNTVLYYEIYNSKTHKNKTACYQISFQYGTLVLTE